MLDDLANLNEGDVDFFELAPENWINVGGRFGRAFRQLNEKAPFICHGLSLSIGSHDPLDMAFLKQLKQFFKEYDITLYCEHLSYCSHNGHMYDLMPLPFTEEAACHVAERVKRVQDFLDMPLVLENVSAYIEAKYEMDELAFVNRVAELSGCQLLLDVNNVFVNSVNHGFDPFDYISGVSKDRVRYIHVAGHYEEAPDLLVDTHGADVKEEVWQLLAHAYRIHGVQPTLLERDFNFPDINELLAEVGQIRDIQREVSHEAKRA